MVVATKRLQKQKNYYARVTINFFVFCLIAAPFQFYVEGYSNMYNETAGLAQILKSGLMYFYAITLAVEAFLRLEHYPNLIRNNIKIHILRYVLVLPILLFIFQYFVSPYYSGDDKLPRSEQILQVGTGLLAFLLSLVVHHVVSRREMKRVR